VPGVYSGQYECTGGSDASTPGSGGPLSFKLEGDKGASALTIAPGTQLTFNWTGLTFTGDLTGSLDCRTNKLKAAMSNITNATLSATITINGSGEFSADYDASSSTPAFVGGVISQPREVSLSSFGPVAGNCSWTAALR
jgi:hypothetical protein